MPRAAVLILLAAVLSPTAAAWSGTRPPEGRYGPTPPDDADIAPYVPLTWPGKTTAATPSEVPAPAPALAEPMTPPAPRSAAAAAPPTNLYAAAQSQGQAPRRYSVHREFGVAPDPTPLPPQFFAGGPAADMAAPPLEISRSPAGPAANAAAIRARAEAADPDPVDAPAADPAAQN
jgi:hypothetical protein